MHSNRYTTVRLSQSPSLLISSSAGSWPQPAQREGLLSPYSTPNLRDQFSSRRFYPIMNGFTDAPSIKPDHATLNVTLIQIRLNWVYFCGLYSPPPPSPFVLSPVFKYKALIVGVLTSSIWVLYQGRIFLAAMERKNITDLFCFERAHYKVFIMARANLTILTYLNSNDESPFCFRYLFVLTCFDNSWRHTRQGRK